MDGASPMWMTSVRMQSKFRFSRQGGAVVLCLALSSVASAQQAPLTDSAKPKAGAAVPAAQAAKPASNKQAAPPKPSSKHSHTHQDHDAKHGGIFFMALDERHHLEGALDSPGTFRVFLYDAYTRTLPKTQLAKAEAKVIWGPQDNAPTTPMKVAADGAALEAPAPGKLTLPVELTLLIRFPGAPANSRPELFTFPFAKFTPKPAKK